MCWAQKANTAAENGVFYGWTTESGCKAACLSSPSCVAIDFGAMTCLHHNNISDLATELHVPGITLFVLNSNCQPTSPSGSFTAYSVSIYHCSKRSVMRYCHGKLSVCLSVCNAGIHVLTRGKTGDKKHAYFHESWGKITGRKI